MSFLTSLGSKFGLGNSPSGEEKMYGGLAGQAGLNMGMDRGNLLGIAGQANDYSNSLLPQSNSAFQNYMNYLGRNTTDQDRGAYINQATSGLDRAYQQGQYGLANNLRARGLSPESSVGIGGLSLLEGQHANAMGGAINDAYNHFDQMRQQNLGTIAGQTYGRQQNAQSQAAGLYGQQQGADMSAASMYNNLLSQAQERRQQQQQQRLQMLGQFAGGVGSLFGMQTPMSGKPGLSSNRPMGGSDPNANMVGQMTMNSMGGYLSPSAQSQGRYNRFQTDWGSDLTPEQLGIGN